MSTVKSKIARTASVAALALLMTAGVTSAAQADQTEGEIEIAGDTSIEACQDVGGGTWCYGAVPNGLLKRCYSNYIHPHKGHTATTLMGNAVSRKRADAGHWANSSATGGWLYTCYARWSVEG